MPDTPLFSEDTYEPLKGPLILRLLFALLRSHVRAARGLVSVRESFSLSTGTSFLRLSTCLFCAPFLFWLTRVTCIHYSRGPKCIKNIVTDSRRLMQDGRKVHHLRVSRCLTWHAVELLIGRQ